MRLLICDDEELIVHDIQRIIESSFNGEHTTVGFTGVSEIAAYLIDNKDAHFDAAIVDIVLRDGSGISTAEYLKAKFPAIKLIFVTGFSRYIQDIYLKLCPSAVLTKPIKPDILIAGIKRLTTREENPAQNCILILGGKHIPASDIIFAESASRKIKLHTPGNTVEYYGKLGELDSLLPSELFVRCHKSNIINLTYVTELTASNAVMITGEQVPVSKSCLEQTEKSLLRFKGGLL